jgi:arginase
MNKLKVGIVKNIHNGHLGAKERDPNPAMIENGGLYPLLEELDCEVVEVVQAELTEEEDKAYGARNRMALASNHTADHIASMIRRNIFPIGLLSNCNQLMGMLAGHQRVQSRYSPLKVGLVWMDAHGDFNTPETSLSGMVGGMPVAVSTGLCLHHIRRTCGLDPPLPMSYVTMLGVRDTDPWEQYLIDQHRISQISVEDVRNQSSIIESEINRLAELTDFIYIHIDLDVLDTSEMPGHSTPAENGPTAVELSKTLESMFKHPKVRALGLASYPGVKDTEKIGLRSTLKLVEGAVKGVQSRVLV